MEQIKTITPLTSDHRQALMDFLQHDPIVNGLAISELSIRPLEGFAEWSDGVMASVLLNFPDRAYYFAREPRPVDGYLPFMREFDLRKIVGQPHLLKSFQLVCKVEYESHSTMLLLQALPLVRITETVHTGETEKDVEAMLECLLTNEEYSFLKWIKPRFVRDQLQQLALKTLRIRVIKSGDLVMATASTIDEGASACLLVGVATRPEDQRKTFGRQVVGSLCTEMIQEKKIVYCFVDHIVSAGMYLSIGFEPVSEWLILGLEAFEETVIE